MKRKAKGKTRTNRNRSEQRACVRKLQRRLKLPVNERPTDDELDELEGVLRYLATIEEGPTTTHARRLIASGIELPPPDEIAEDAIHDKLWEVIRGLASHRCYLLNTDHFGDLELYRRLWEETLNQSTYELDEEMGDCACHIDFVSSGSEEDTRDYLKYYATEQERWEWELEYPEDEIPDHVDPPHDRDRHLPGRDSFTRR